MKCKGFRKNIFEELEKVSPVEKVKKIGVIGGSGFSSKHVDEMKMFNIDVMISGDLTYHSAQNLDAENIGAWDM